MRHSFVLVALAMLGVVPPASAQEAQQPKLDLDKVWTPADSVDGRRVLDSLPALINCPRFDPKDVRGDETTFSFERGAELEQRPQNIEAEIEFIVRRDGRIDRRRIKVLRSTDHRLERSLEYWLRRCVYRPGKIGEVSVQVRLTQKFELEIVP